MFDRGKHEPKKERMLANAIFSVLIAVGGVIALVSHEGVRAQRLPRGVIGGGTENIGIDSGRENFPLQNTQNIERLLEEAPSHSLKYENPAESPFLVTESNIRFARIEESDQTRRKDQIVRNSVYYQLSVNLLNRTNQFITGIAVEITGESGEQDSSSRTRFRTRLQNTAVGIAPGQNFRFSSIYTSQDEDNPGKLVDHLVLWISGARFEDGNVWGSIPMESSKFVSSSSKWRVIDTESPKNPAQARVEGETLEVFEASQLLRPTILSRPKGDYTQNARDHKIQGVVILEVIFRADGNITGIKIIRGLPEGLTEKAIEAARNIRFEPAMKNGVPVNVRAKLEYLFNLY